MAAILRLRIVFTIIYLIIFVTTANSQISISSSDILALKGTSRAAYSPAEEGDTVLITPGGINQTWDYRNLNTDRFISALLEYLDPSGGFRADLFTEANFRQRISAATEEGSFFMDTYMNVSSNILRSLGSASDIAGFSFIEKEDDDSAPLPLTYGTNWISVTNDTSDQIGFKTITNDSTWNNVDAYGILRLPMGDIECLRLRAKSKEITESSFNGSPLGPPDTTIQVSYIWFSKNHLHTFIVDIFENNLGEVSMSLAGTATSIEEYIGLIPQEYRLEQNYPNPFNPTTAISYSLKNPGNVSLKVIDVLGREVATLIDERKNNGTYLIQFDGSNLPSGVYFYRIEAGNFVETKKMLLMK